MGTILKLDRNGRCVGEYIKGKTILFNTAIMTGGPGAYTLRESTQKEFQKIWQATQAENRISAIGHEATAGIFSVILGEDVPVNRIPAVQEPGDVGLVMKMNGRIMEGTVITDMKELERIGYSLLIMEKF